MKQLFVDILTKMTPVSINNSGIQYVIKNGDKNLYVDIDWRYVNPRNVPKLGFTLPFSVNFTDYRWDQTSEYSQKVYTLRINDCTY